MPTPEESQKQVQSAGEDIAKIKKDLQKTDLIMIGIIIVLFIGFFGVAVALGGIIVDNLRSREASYQDLVNTINEENNKIDLLFDELRKTNTELIKTKSLLETKCYLK